MFDGLRNLAKVVRGDAQILDDHAHVVLIVADQSIEPLRRLIDMSDHAVHVTVLRQERIDPRGSRVEFTQRLIDRRRGEDPIDALESSAGLREHIVRVRGELRDRNLVELPVEIAEESVQIARQRPDVRFVETRHERLHVGDYRAGDARRGRHVRVLRGPLEFEQTGLRWIDEIDREILLTGDAGELSLRTQSLLHHLSRILLQVLGFLRGEVDLRPDHDVLPAPGQRDIRFIGRRRGHDLGDVTQRYTPKTHRRAEIETRHGFVEVRFEREGRLEELAAAEQEKHCDQHAARHHDECPEPHVTLAFFHGQFALRLCASDWRLKN